MTKRNLFADEKLALARMWFIDACISSQMYDDMLRHACETFGDYGPVISGAGRAHFPETVKERLRSKAKWVGFCSKMAWESKPPRYHDSTMRALASQCADRHGSGFYGPQPSRAVA